MRFCLLIAVLFVSLPAWATTYYVKQTGGNDSHGCTNDSGDQCLTIQHGANVAAGAGNLLYVEAGTYTEDPTISSGGTGTGANMFTVQGFAPGGSCPTSATSDPSGAIFGFPTVPAPTALLIGHVTITANYTSWQCFEMEPNPPEYMQFAGYTGTGDLGNAIYSTGTATDIENNYIHKNPSYSGSVHAFGRGCTITGTAPNKANNCGGYAYNQAIRIKGDLWTVKGNFMDHAAAQQTFLTCVTIHACLFQDNEEYGGEDELAGGTQSNNNHYDMDYNEQLNGVDLEHDYMHGMDQVFCNAAQNGGSGPCHIDCYETNNFSSSNTLINRSVCFNTNQVYFFGDQSGNVTYGSYSVADHEQVTNSISAFGPGNGGFNICLSAYHAQVDLFAFNLCWGAYDSAGGGSQILQYHDNILYGNLAANFTGPIYATGNSQYPSEGHNLEYLKGYNITGGSSTDLKNVDPLFLAPGAYDNADTLAHNLHLQSGSPARSAGVTLAAVPLDFDRVTRGSPPDIGPYQFQAVNTNCGSRVTLTSTPTSCTVTGIVTGGVLVLTLTGHLGTGSLTPATPTDDQSNTYVLATTGANASLNLKSYVYYVLANAGAVTQLNLAVGSGSGSFSFHLDQSTSVNTLDQSNHLDNGNSTNAVGAAITTTHATESLWSAGFYSQSFTGSVSSPFVTDFADPGAYAFIGNVSATGTYSADETQSSSGGYENAVISFYNSSSAPIVSLSTATVDFGSQQLDQGAGQLVVTITNTGNASLSISSAPALVSGAHFTLSTDCTASLGVNATCHDFLGIKTDTLGSFTDTVTMTDNASGSPHTFTVKGTIINCSPTIICTSARGALPL